EQAGHFGDGVVVGPIPSVTGLAFERVYVVGLVEGTLPPTPAPDPFGDPMGLVDRRRAEERRAFLVAVACADGGRLVLSTPDSTGGRPAYPSRWLLEVAAGLEGRSSLATSEFRRLRNGDSRPWLRVVLSAQNGVERASAAADLEDRRLAEAIAVVRSGQLARHPLALREDLPLGRGLASIRARRSSAFTAFDGNLIDRAADSRRLSGTSTGIQPTSATAIEQWATCPFRYFLSHVLRVEPTRRPEESWSLDPLERGTLIHEILCLFMREQVQRGGPPAVYGDDDIALIESIAGSSFTERERSGVTGHPLVWSTVRSAIVAELRAFLARDQAWREANNCHPWRFEQAFGTPASASWPEVEIPVGDASMRFRGVIDRVDRAADGSRAYVVDYKTGDSKSYESIRDDPVLGGQHLQLALYTQAVRDEAGAPVPAAGCFWFTSRGSRVTHAAIPDDPDAVRRRLKEALEQVATGIGQGAFPQVPGAEASTSFANCRYCDFVRVCPSAVDDVWARKRLSPAHQLHSRLALGHQELGDEEESD